MFALIRISAPHLIKDQRRGVTTYLEPDHVWNIIEKNHERWGAEGVKPLYMTHRHLQDDTSLIVDCESSDALVEFIVENLATIEHVRGIWVINMGKMRFFGPPLEHSRGFPRFTITIDAMPKHIKEVFDSISNFEPGRDIVINYVAQTFQSFQASIMVSALARSREHLEAFVYEYIRSQPGVLSAEITYISRTKRLVSSEDWKKLVAPCFHAASGKQIKDFEVQDDSTVAGC